MGSIEKSWHLDVAFDSFCKLPVANLALMGKNSGFSKQARTRARTKIQRDLVIRSNETSWSEGVPFEFT